MKIKTIKNHSYKKIANRVSITTIIVNIFLSAFKFFAGIIGNSSAMISDAVHSASDVFSTIIVMIGIKISTKKPDKTHPYGHDRLECVAAILLATVLFITGCGIGIEAVKDLISTKEINLPIPGVLSLISAISSIIIKEAMYWYTRFYAQKIGSGALMADAWHHRSDALSSIGALIGIVGARLGFEKMDALASLLIFFFIAKASYDIYKDAIHKIVDHSCDDDTFCKIYSCALENENVLGIDNLKTRVFANHIYIDIEISADPNISLSEAHNIAQDVHDKIENKFENVRHVMVHVNPKE